MDDFNIKLNRKAIQDIAKGGDMQQAMALIGGVAELAAKGFAPVDTGNLRRSITHEVEEDAKGWYARYGTNVQYGIYQELGTRHHASHPYLRPALERVRQFLGQSGVISPGYNDLEGDGL